MCTAGTAEGASGTDSEPGATARDGCRLPLEVFLEVVGRRVRRRRTLMHMSRRRLAECSGVSERYLAQLERGQGNMTIALLRRVAVALKLPLPELVAESDAETETEIEVARLDRS